MEVRNGSGNGAAVVTPTKWGKIRAGAITIDEEATNYDECFINGAVVEPFPVLSAGLFLFINAPSSLESIFK